MKKATYYHLYCLNPHCRISIYQNTRTMCLEVNPVNFLAEHHCKHCQHRLVSLMDMKITEIAASASVQLSVQLMPVCLN